MGSRTPQPSSCSEIPSLRSARATRRPLPAQTPAERELPLPAPPCLPKHPGTRPPRGPRRTGALGSGGVTRGQEEQAGQGLSGRGGFAEASNGRPEAKARLRLPACCSLPWRASCRGTLGCIAAHAMGHRHGETVTAIASSRPWVRLVLLPRLLTRMGTHAGVSLSSLPSCHRRCHSHDTVQNDVIEML